MLQGNHNSPLGLPLATKGTQELSIINSQSLGRTQLAQMYFPYIQPRSAWLKLKSLLSELKSLLSEEPDLEHLTRLRRRTFLPAEVNIIYQHLGQP